MEQNEDLEVHVLGLVQMFGCSHEAAQRAFIRHWPDMNASIEELQRKQRPCFVALEVFSLQRVYMQNLRDAMLPIEGTSLPYFREEYRSKSCDGYPTLTWAEVGQCINNGPVVEVFFINGRAGIASDFSAYEEYYQYGIVAEDFKDIIGFISAVDGLVPLVDYLHVRHFTGLSPLQSLQHHLGQPSDLNGGACKTMSHLNVISHSEPNAAKTGKTRRRILFGNDVYTSITHRQDKAGMQLVLNHHGLPYIRGVSTYDVNTAKQWRLTNKIPFPVIVKPVSGAGSEFVTLCRSEEDIDAAFALCSGEKTLQMTDASHMLLQEYIEGQEYVVNVVSYKGKHVVSDVWKSWKCPYDVFSSRLRQPVEEKKTGGFSGPRHKKQPNQLSTTVLLYDRLEFVHNLAELPGSCEERRVVAYTLKCIDALGMRQGCSHCEVRIDDRLGSSTKGMPILIELNARMLGDVPRATSLVGYNQYTLMMYLVLCAVSIPEHTSLSTTAERTDTEEQWSMLPWPPAPLLYRSLLVDTTRHVIFLRVAEESYVCLRGARTIQALPTFKHLSRDTTFDDLKPGMMMRLHKTVDLLSSPGACLMEGSVGDIERDTAYIRRVENKDLSEWKRLLDDALVVASQILQDPLEGSDVLHSAVLSVGQTETSPLAKKFRAARGKVEEFFRCMGEPPLFIPVEYIEKLKRLGVCHLVCSI